MKRFSVLLIAALQLLFVQSAKSQRSAIGFFLTGSEYSGDLSAGNNNFYKFRNFKPGLGISVQHPLNNSFNLVGWAGYNHLQYLVAPKNFVLGQSNGVDASFYNLNAMLKYKFNNGYLLKENAMISPFVMGGLGISSIQATSFPGVQDINGTKTKGGANASVMGGVGVFFRFSDVVGIEASSMMNMPFADEWDGIKKGGNDMYLQHSIGLVFTLKKAVDTDKDGVSDKKDICPNTPKGVSVDSKGCPVDTDGDGVADYQDKCPKVAGLPALKGCPDSDKDGIADAEDKCPNVKGLAKFAGCPDTDGDGVEDSKDRCAKTPAGAPVDAKGCPLDSDGDRVADYKDKCPNTPKGVKVDVTGCPVDNDGDGVPNAKDKCPDNAGPASNNGCPEVKAEAKKRLTYATKGIYFETGKATLKPESFVNLDEVVKIINEYPDYNLRLSGHTDDVGNDEKNQTLSQARVDAVKAYIVGKGIAENRMEAKGYGETRPIASNKTAAGRAENRRVEMELYLR